MRYAFAGLVVPVALAIWAGTALATRSACSLGLMIQLMFLLVGWHYVKQGFGVMTVLAARRGVRFLPHERLTILAHCYAGWAYAWASPWDPGKEVEEKGVVYTTIAHPAWLENATHVVFLASAVLLLGVLAQKWRREGRLPILTPLTALLSSIWAWSIYSSIDPLVVYAVPALHSVQYLYFVWLMKGNEAREREGPPWFERSAGVRVGFLAVAGARPRLGALSRSPGRAGRPSGPEARAFHRSRRDPVLRGALRVRQHPPLLHGQRRLAARKPRDALPVRPSVVARIRLKAALAETGDGAQGEDHAETPRRCGARGADAAPAGAPRGG